METARYKTKPVEPTPVEVVLLTEDNLQEAADWWNSFLTHDMSLKRVEALLDTMSETGEPVLLIPFPGGGFSCIPAGCYLVHFGCGDMQGLTAEAFHQAYEPHTLPESGMCSCLSPAMSGTAEGDGPMVWEPTCTRCGRPLTPEALTYAENWRG